ncbi:MAG: hypothetical protein OCD76_16490 [Reichenbachiella sp.]
MNQINFKQERDLGATLQDASSFIKQNFIKILKPTLTVVIAPLILSTVLMVISMQSMYANMADMANSPGDPAAMFGAMTGMIPAYLLIIVTYVMTYIMFIGYIKLYAAGKEDITLGDLSPILKSKIIPLFIGTIVLVIVIYIGMILCLLPGIYLAVVLAHFYAISIIEDVGFGASWKRCFYIIKNNWWSTFGLFIVTQLIVMGIMIVFYIPMYAVMALEMFQAVDKNDPTAMFNSMSTAMSYVMPIYQLLIMVVSLLFAVVSSFRYYSLVEQKDGSGEREIINQL